MEAVQTRRTHEGADCEGASCKLFELAKSAEVKPAEVRIIADPPPLDPSSDDPAEDMPLYQARRKIYPQRVHGTYRRIKWVVLFVTLGIYYLTPFLRWDRGPNAPDQAVLIDLPHRRFYFFFLEIWPQEVYYLTVLLILAAITLFLMNAIGGRFGAAISARRRCGPICFKRSSAGARVTAASTFCASSAGGPPSASRVSSQSISSG